VYFLVHLKSVEWLNEYTKGALGSLIYLIDYPLEAILPGFMEDYPKNVGVTDLGDHACHENLGVKILKFSA
jgi:hypothetical protein